MYIQPTSIYSRLRIGHYLLAGLVARQIIMAVCLRCARRRNKEEWYRFYSDIFYRHVAILLWKYLQLLDTMPACGCLRVGKQQPATGVDKPSMSLQLHRWQHQSIRNILHQTRLAMASGNTRNDIADDMGEGGDGKSGHCWNNQAC